MDCIKIREIVPLYIEHRVSDTNTQVIEEHLCVCNDCRQFLSQYMDRLPVNEAEKHLINNNSKPRDDSKNQAVLPLRGIGIFEYIILSVGFVILGFFVFLFLKG